MSTAVDHTGRRRGACSLAATLVLGLGLGACGDDEQTSTSSTSTEEAPLSSTTSTAPTTSSTTESTATTSTTESTTTGTTEDENGRSGGVGGDEAPGSTKPPEPGSPEDKFEKFCDENPDACS